jgi:hypothetical protein
MIGTPESLSLNAPPKSSSNRAELIERCLRLPQGRPARYACLKLLQCDRASTTAVADLLHVLSGLTPRRFKEMELVLDVLGHLVLDTKDRERLAEQLAVVLRDDLKAQPYRLIRGVIGSIIVGGAGCFLFAYALSQPSIDLAVENFPNSVAPLLIGVISVATVLLLFVPSSTLARFFAAGDRRSDKLRITSAKMLGSLQSPFTITDLAGALSDKNAALRSAASDALLSSLPSITPKYYNALPFSTVPNLCSALEIADQRLALAILQALKLIGDGRAIRAVTSVMRTGRDSILFKVAEETLAAIKEREAANREPQRLLRPSEAPMTLLRPAKTPLESLPRLLQPSAHVDPDKMLRPASVEDTPPSQ